MSLLTRLKPEYLEKLELHKLESPYLYEQIILSLKENDYFTELRIIEANNLLLILNIPFDLGNLSGLFR